MRRRILIALLALAIVARIAWVIGHAPAPEVVPGAGPVDADWDEALEEMRAERGRDGG